MSLLDAITEYIKYGEYASSEIVKAIEEIKQNEKITPLGGKCFTVKLSDIDRTILSAEYYDFETVKPMLLQQKEPVSSSLILSKPSRRA